MAEIQLHALAHSYLERPKKPDDYAIREMNHIWEQGGAYALLGPSGCGKSTLLNIISGLLQPSEGKILFDGKEVNALPPDKRNIAQVFQFPVVYDSMSVYDNLAFPLRNLKYSKERIHAKVQEVAEVLELDDVLHRRANNLTADEKQKVSMGRGLVRDDVSAILFDEPLTVIDPHLKWKLRRKLKQIHEKFNITMVYVTHDQLEASTFADQIALMYQGQIVQFGTPQELFESPEHTFVGYFIGSPGMNIIEVSLKDGVAVFDDIKIVLDDKTIKSVNEKMSDNIKIGIRPEFVKVVTTTETSQDVTDDIFACDILDIENLGIYKIVTVQLGQEKIKVRVEEDHEMLVNEESLNKTPSNEANNGKNATPENSCNKIHICFPQEHLKVYVDEYLIKDINV